MSSHIATIAAYEIKDGGFRGVMLIRATKERRASEKLETLEAAKFWAKNEAHKQYDEVGYTLAPLRLKGEYQANVWIA